MGIINNQSKASWNDFLLCRKSYGVCISFRKLSSECVMHIAQRHVLTVLLPDQMCIRDSLKGDGVKVYRIKAELHGLGPVSYTHLLSSDWAMSSAAHTTGM